MPASSAARAAAFVAGLAVALGLAVVLAGPLTNAFHTLGWNWEMGSTFRRLWLALTLAVVAGALRPWRDVPAGTWGLWGPGSRPVTALGGAGLAVLLLGAIAGGEALAGWLAWDKAQGAEKWAHRWPEAVARGVLVAGAEALFFRGWLLDRCLARWKPLTASLVAAAAFALPHVFKASAAPHGLATNPAGAVAALRAWAGGAVDLEASLPRLAALFLLGVALAAARLRTRSLWLEIGFHGTALVLLAAVSAWTDRTPERNWAGGKWLYDGAPGCALLALLAFALWPRGGESQAGTPPPPGSAPA